MERGSEEMKTGKGRKSTKEVLTSRWPLWATEQGGGGWGGVDPAKDSV